MAVHSSDPPGAESLESLRLCDDTTEVHGKRDRAAVLVRQPYLFVVLEADRPLAGGARMCLHEIDEVIVARGRERSVAREDTGDKRRLVLRLPARALSSVHARIRREGAVWRLADAGSTNGCYVGGERVAVHEVGPKDVIELGRVFLLLREAEAPIDETPSDLDAAELEGVPAALATLNPELALRLRALERVADSHVSVVLSGESGTGKELLATAIHGLSRRAGAFVAVNCGALTESLTESQLFGHVRGAFSGAVSEAIGFVRAADGGTLLLDEVNELSRSAQAALLRVLQEREVVPVGSARPHKVDVRFIATTPLPLPRLVRDGSFRPDLFARLSGFSYALPPLQQRREDIGVLVAALLRKGGVGEADRPALSRELSLRLVSHDWPLNARELEQRLGRLWVLARDGVMDEEPEPSELDLLPNGGAPSAASPRRRVLSDQDRALRGRLLEALTESGGNIALVARSFGKAPMQVHRWMKRLDIDPRTFRSGTRR